MSMPSTMMRPRVLTMALARSQLPIAIMMVALPTRFGGVMHAQVGLLVVEVLRS